MGHHIIKKNFFRLSVLLLAIVTVGVLYSRAAYAALIMTIILFAVISKRTKYLPIFFICFSILLFTNVFQSVKERALWGMETDNPNYITAGRTGDIWLPLYQEYTQDYAKLLIGDGRYSIYTTKPYQAGIIFAGHPHSMYLEQIVDAGLIGFSIVGVFYILIFKIMLLNLKDITHPILREYQFAILCSMLTYFISGIVGRSLFPELANAFLWIIIGFIFVSERLHASLVDQQET